MHFEVYRPKCISSGIVECRMQKVAPSRTAMSAAEIVREKGSIIMQPAITGNQEF